MSKENENVSYHIKQEPRDKDKDKEEKKNYLKISLKIAFNLIIQLLPVWFMMLLQFLTSVKHDRMDYVSNILIFIVMSSITNIVSLDVQADFMKYMSGLILCFALFFYTLTLISDGIDLGIKTIPMQVIAFVFCIIVFMLLFFQEVRRENCKR